MEVGAIAAAVDGDPTCVGRPVVPGVPARGKR